jgi:molecular chaperone DnaJ
VDVPTINGKETIKIEPGTESGKIITLKKKGAPDPNSSRKGDLHIGLIVKIPKKIDKESKKILMNLKSTIGEKYVLEDNKELAKFIQASE